MYLSVCVYVYICIVMHKGVRQPPVERWTLLSLWTVTSMFVVNAWPAGVGFTVKTSMRAWSSYSTQWPFALLRVNPACWQISKRLGSANLTTEVLNKQLGCKECAFQSSTPNTKTLQALNAKTPENRYALIPEIRPGKPFRWWLRPHLALAGRARIASALRRTGDSSGVCM